MRVSPTAFVARAAVLIVSFAVFGASAHAAGFGTPQKLFPVDVGTQPDSNAFSDFGASVELDGETLFVGEPRERDPDISFGQSGSVSVYELVNGSWQWVQRLDLGPSAPSNQFGTALAVDGSTAMVSAHGGLFPGSVHIYEHDGIQWSSVQVIQSPIAEIGAQFGFAIDLEGDLAVIGARLLDRYATDSGTAYVYRNVGGIWQLEVELVPSVTPETDDWFGFSVAIDGDTVVVGEPHLVPGSLPGDIGSAHVFFYDGATWNPQEVLSSGLVESRYGWDVAIVGDVISVLEFSTGFAYQYRRVGGAWSLEDSFRSFPAATSLDAQLNHVLVGYGGFDQSALYANESGVWIEQDLTTDDVAGSSEEFGSSVSMDGVWGAIGAPADPTNGQLAGAAYVFPLKLLDAVSMKTALKQSISDTDLHPGLENALLTKVDGAIDACLSGDDGGAINRLNALQNQVNAQRGKKITDAQASSLTDQIQAVLAVLTSM